MNPPTTFIINETVWLMSKHADAMLRESFNISYAWFVCMAALSPIQPCSQHALAEALNYSDAAVSRLVQKLANAGLITLEDDVQPGRRNIVRITPHGATVFHEATKLLEAEFGRALAAAGVNRDQLTALHVALNTVLREGA